MTCPTCDGEGYLEVATGFRITGSGFGDCEPTYRVEDCDVCDGTGEQEDDPTE